MCVNVVILYEVLENNLYDNLRIKKYKLALLTPALEHKMAVKQFYQFHIEF